NGKEKRTVVNQSGSRRISRVSLLCRGEDGKHGDLLRATAAAARRSADLRGIEISIQILGPVGVAGIGKVMWCRAWCIVRVAHFHPFHTWTGRAWARLGPRIKSRHPLSLGGVACRGA